MSSSAPTTTPNRAPRASSAPTTAPPGTAVLIEASRALRKLKRRAGAPEIRFVLFDGEEEPGPTDDFYDDALRGSKAYVAAHAGEIRAMFLLDYVGNKGLRLPREAHLERVAVGPGPRGRQARRRPEHFPDGSGPASSTTTRRSCAPGCPAVDLIDWDYRYTDTTRDTLDKLAVSSLDAVGETIVETLRAYR